MIANIPWGGGKLSYYFISSEKVYDAGTTVSSHSIQTSLREFEEKLIKITQNSKKAQHQKVGKF